MWIGAWPAGALAQIAATLAVSSTALAAGPGSLSDEARSTVSIAVVDGAIETHTVNRSFQTVQLYRPGETAPRTLLLRQEVDIVTRTDAEGPGSAKVRLDAWEIGKGAKRQVAWRIDAEGEEGKVTDGADGMPFFEVERYGCCGARESSTTYSLINGRKLYSATAPAAWFDVPNSGGIVRLAAVHAALSMDDDKVFAGRQDAVGLITYATPAEPRRRILVTLRGPATIEEVVGDPQPTFVLDGTSEAVASLTLWKSDGKKDAASIGGLSLEVVFSPGAEVTIPIANDDLDLARATTSPNLAIEALPGN